MASIYHSSEQSLNVLHVSAAYAPFVGGAEVYARQIAERLVNDGHSAAVATTNAAEVEAFWHPRKQQLPAGESLIGGVRVWRAPIRYLPGSPLTLFVLRRLAVNLSHYRWGAPLGATLSRFMPWVPSFEQMLRTLPCCFDLVHGINLALERTFIAAHRFAKRNKIPFVATPFVHLGVLGSTYVARNYTMPHQLQTLREAEAVLVQTDSELKALNALGVARERMHLLGVGVDPKTLQGGDGYRFRANFGLLEEMPIVAYVGVLTKDKGVHHLIEAAHHLWLRGQRNVLVLVGRATDEFEALWSRLPASRRQHVLRLGTVDEERKKDLLAAADVLVLPSRVDSFGIVLLEAWLYGKPVIGARAGGIPDVISEGEDGLLVEYGDVAGLAQALDRLLREPSLREAMGRAGQIKVLTRYTWDHVFTRLMSIYEEVLSRHGRAR